MGARRRCCCGGCEVFRDEFNRTGPAVGNGWDELHATGVWGIYDTALLETSGTGEIIHGTEVRQWDDGYGCEYDIHDEAAGNVYRIIFGATSSEAGADCIIAEYEVGELTDPVTYTSAVRIYTRAGGVESLVAEKLIPPQAVDANGGRRFYAWYHNTYDDGSFCVWLGTSAYPSLMVETGLTPPGRYFGVANASGALPIEIDNFTIELATEAMVDGEMSLCFYCTCPCLKYTNDDPDSGELLERAMYPGVLNLNITGGCCEPLFPGADTTGCTDGVNEDIALEFDADYPTVGFNQWVNHSDFVLCGRPFQFRVICDGEGRLSLTMYYVPAGYEGPPPTWFPIPESGAVIITRDSHSCEPIEEVFTLTLMSLSGFPCCAPLSKGEFTITITG